MDSYLQITEKLADFKKISIDDFIVLKSPREYKRMIFEKSASANVLYIACLVLSADDETLKLFDILENRMKNKNKTVIFIDKSRNKRDTKVKEEIEKRGLKSVFKFVNLSRSRYLPYFLNELLHVFHDKAYIFDDEICISGANLNDTYFTNRIDRYFLFENKEFVNQIKKYVFFDYTGLIEDIESEQVSMDSEISVYSSESYNQNYSGRSLTTLNNLSFFDLPKGVIADSYIFSYKSQDELSVFSKLFAEKHKEIYISTAYLNFSSKHIQILKNLKVTIFTTSPKTNTFNNFDFLGNIITDIYAYSSYKTMQYLPKCKLYEFEEPNCSFHSKGMWLFNDEYCVTIIGSSNFNNRSIYLDKECSHVIISRNPNHRKKLYEEIENIRKSSKVKLIHELRVRKVRMLAIILFYLLNLFI